MTSYNLSSLLPILILASFYIIESFSAGFTLELIHRDYSTSTKSPLFYNPNQNHHPQRKAKSNNNPRPSKFTPNSPQPELSPGLGNYLMSLSIGTPPFKILGAIDTGSNIIWSQCIPCYSCSPETDDPIFDPSKSTTYKIIPCSSDKCFYQDSCEGPNCDYLVLYPGRSYSTGIMALETLGLDNSNDGSSVSFHDIVVGCSKESEAQSLAVVGLGGGAASLITQLNSSIGGKFSYCLAPPPPIQGFAGKINFGENAVVSGSSTVSIPMAPPPPQYSDTLYYLKWLGMTVDLPNKRELLEYNIIGDEEFTSTTNNNNNNNKAKKSSIMLIDSGSEFTYIPDWFYEILETLVSGGIKLKRVEDPLDKFELCYESESMEFYAPSIIVHFEGGVDITLLSINTFASFSSGVVCFTFLPTGNYFAILGNLAQINFLIGFDTQERIVSFKPTDCSAV